MTLEELHSAARAGQLQRLSLLSQEGSLYLVECVTATLTILFDLRAADFAITITIANRFEHLLGCRLVFGIRIVIDPLDFGINIDVVGE